MFSGGYNVHLCCRECGSPQYFPCYLSDYRRASSQKYFCLRARSGSGMHPVEWLAHPSCTWCPYVRHNRIRGWPCQTPTYRWMRLSVSHIVPGFFFPAPVCAGCVRWYPGIGKARGHRRVAWCIWRSRCHPATWVRNCGQTLFSGAKLSWIQDKTHCMSPEVAGSADSFRAISLRS